MRFDSLDLRREGRSFRFSGLREEVRAHALDEVLPALARVERGVAEGLHAAGFVGYEAAPAFDPALVVRSPSGRWPLLWFGLFGERIEGPALEGLPLPGGEVGPLAPSLSEARHREVLERIHGWIAAGDSYQVNHTFRLRGRYAGDEEALYARLCRSQEAGFCAALHLQEGSVLSASPELFFRWSGETLELRPMKGTRPRGRWSGEDEQLAGELLASPKERAENLMIVDLLRNDAGRISEFGSVHVPRLFEVERYPTVHQLTSTVRSRTRVGTTLTDLFRSLFPCGSVTGAPKVRTMQIIAEVEDSPRELYTGAIGFVSPGEAVFSVGIRTLLLDGERKTVELGVGSGITSDATAGDEYRECLAKAAFVRLEPSEFELLESIRYDAPGGWTMREGHLRRLAGSARYWDFRLEEGVVRDRLDAAVEGAAPGAYKVRLLLARTGEVRVELHPLEASDAPVRLGISPEPVDSRDRFLYHKTTRRAPYERRRALRPDCDEVLLVNERGELTEATTANLVVRRGEELWTPPLDSGLLPGVMRESLLASGEIRERTLRVPDLADAEEIFLVSSVRGWRRAVRV